MYGYHPVVAHRAHGHEEKEGVGKFKQTSKRSTRYVMSNFLPLFSSLWTLAKTFLTKHSRIVDTGGTGGDKHSPDFQVRNDDRRDRIPNRVLLLMYRPQKYDGRCVQGTSNTFIIIILATAYRFRFVSVGRWIIWKKIQRDETNMDMRIEVDSRQRKKDGDMKSRMNQ